MLSPQQIAHLQAFGFIALGGLLGDGGAAALVGEATGVLGAGDPG